MNVTIDGASHDAVFRWDSQNIALVRTGGASWATDFDTAPGDHIYSIIVFGAPQDPWSASVTDSVTTHPHTGIMSVNGSGGTGSIGSR